MKTTYTVFFKMPTYNQNKTYFQNANRYCASRFCSDMETVQAVINDGISKGWQVKRVIANNTGKNVNV